MPVGVNRYRDGPITAMIGRPQLLEIDRLGPGGIARRILRGLVQDQSTAFAQACTHGDPVAIAHKIENAWMRMMVMASVTCGSNERILRKQGQELRIRARLGSMVRQLEPNDTRIHMRYTCRANAIIELFGQFERPIHIDFSGQQQGATEHAYP